MGGVGRVETWLGLIDVVNILQSAQRLTIYVVRNRRCARRDSGNDVTLTVRPRQSPKNSSNGGIEKARAPLKHESNCVDVSAVESEPLNPNAVKVSGARPIFLNIESTQGIITMRS